MISFETTSAIAQSFLSFAVASDSKSNAAGRATKTLSCACAEPLDREVAGQRRVAGDARLAAQRESDGRPLSGLMRALRGLRVDEQPENGVFGILQDQLTQQPGGIAVAAGAGIVLGVGE